MRFRQSNLERFLLLNDMVISSHFEVKSYNVLITILIFYNKKP